MNRESWKLIDLLTTASDYLAEKEIEHPRRNAEALLGKALAVPRIELYLQYDRPMRQPEIDAFREMIRRRLNREPLQQILGEVEFLGCRLTTPKGLLVPRPETELLASEVLKRARRDYADRSLRILDLGCGTGCLSIALASALPQAYVDAVDIDPIAIDTTAKNAKLNNIEARLHPIQGDMLEDSLFSRLTVPYDVVVSNPPYVRAAEYASLAPEIRHFENPQALIGGDDGFRFYRRIAQLLPRLLDETGFAALELGYDQADEVESLMAEQSLTSQTFPDLNGVERMLFVTRRTA